MTQTDMVVRLLVAASLGGLVGFEREIAGRAAGFRTHILVSVGSALVMLTSIYLASESEYPIDPTRMAAQVVSGIGFLGAGTIIRAGNTVRGLTTAASLWVVSAVGIAAGCGFWTAAAFTTALILMGLLIFGRLAKRYHINILHEEDKHPAE